MRLGAAEEETEIAPADYLARLGQSGDGPHDIATAALMLSALDHPEKKLAPFRAHLAELAQAARAQGFVYSEATAKEISGLGRRSAAIKCDVTDRAQVEETVRRVVHEFGSVDILVNNAGTLDHVGQLPDQMPELWERDLRVNLTGSFNCAQAVWPHMKEEGWGRIVNMASVAGTLGGFGQASYSTTKAGLLGLTRTLALEGARHGITCNAIVPGVIGTEAFNFGNPAMNQRMVKRTAMRRAGEPQDVANAIVFLCSDLASYITGVGLNVSGGIELFTF